MLRGLLFCPTSMQGLTFTVKHSVCDTLICAAIVKTQHYKNTKLIARQSNSETPKQSHKFIVKKLNSWGSKRFAWNYISQALSLTTPINSGSSYRFLLPSSFWGIIYAYNPNSTRIKYSPKTKPKYFTVQMWAISFLNMSSFSTITSNKLLRFKHRTNLLKLKNIFFF